ncbi:MAG: hypothetical protein Fur0025_06780 [Oscillatoriaceae cyanobacterium]
MYLSNQIENLFIDVSLSQKITETEWRELVAISESPLSPEVQRMVKRIMHGVRRGWVNVLA